MLCVFPVSGPLKIGNCPDEISFSHERQGLYPRNSVDRNFLGYIMAAAQGECVENAD